MNPIRFVESILFRLRADESGSAMTEFVVGLPVFILIFGGMGMLYRLNNEILISKAKASADLWENADVGAGDFIPILAAGDLLSGDFSTAAQNSTSALGIYSDSYVKTLIPLSTLPGTKPDEGCFTLDCEQIGMTDEYFSGILLDDNMVNGLKGNLSADGWANGISSVLSVTGSRPAIVAGIRYGGVEGESVSSSVSTPMFGDVEFETGNLDVPGITQPTWRGLGVLATRLEFATDPVFNKQIPEFDSDFDFDQSDVPESQGECQQAMETYRGCIDSQPAGDSNKKKARACKSLDPEEQCGGLGSSNPIPQPDASWDP